jgi:2-amino-4-hydroxy-6-hydroxymethyldihydropteridine diphosphokinase/dihydropteroate synthase
MIILGLGSNVGDRFAYLKKALQKIAMIPHVFVKQVSPLYISDALLPSNAPNTWDKPFINCAIRCETTLKPEELLKATKGIELELGRPFKKEHWSPRNIDIDILAWNDLTQYDNQLHIPHEHLTERPFALWPLSDIAPFWVHPLIGQTAVELVAPWGSRFDGNALFHTKQIQHRLDTAELVGILNLTPNSFSNDGKFLNPEAAINHLIHLVNSGATIIDIGAQATGPSTCVITAEEEWMRLEPVLSAFSAIKDSLILPPKISIDTYHPETVKKAYNYDIDWINDVSGGMNPAMQSLLAEQATDIVIMHQLGIPAGSKKIPLNQNPVEVVYQWAEKQLELFQKIGIDKQRIILDVGIGYGNTPEQAMLLLNHCHHFKKLGARLLVGHSRKSFLNNFTSNPANERDYETVALSLLLNNLGVDYLRVHNVAAHAQAFKVSAAFN